MAHKTAIVITMIIIAIIVGSCTNGNSFKTPEIFDYDDYDYSISNRGAALYRSNNGIARYGDGKNILPHRDGSSIFTNHTINGF